MQQNEYRREFVNEVPDDVPNILSAVSYCLFFADDHLTGIELRHGVESGMASGSNVEALIGFTDYVDPYAEDSNWEDVLRLRNIVPNRT
jgi:hypothetical protein